MSFRMLELHGMMVDKTTAERGGFSLSFSQANVIKTMDNAQQRTLWQQSGCLLIRQTEHIQMPGKPAPYVLNGGDLHDNIYVYRDSIRLPLHSQGQVGIEFAITGDEKKLIVSGKEMKIIMQGTARYLQHLDKTQ